MKKIAILGATGHIGKALAHRFSQDDSSIVSLFSRSADGMRKFLDENKISGNAAGEFILGAIDDFPNHDFDIVINCIGIGNPSKLKADPGAIFEVTETYDNLIMSYLEKQRDALFINMSSGAAYGISTGEAVDVGSKSVLDMNAMTSSDFYSVAKINSEAKHRARPDLNIVDLRIFSFFSRFIDLNSGFMMAELADCIINKKTFHTSSDDMIRDYTIADDLFSLIQKCIVRHDETDRFNDVFDAYSRAPVSKLELLDMLKRTFDLAFEIKKPEATAGQGMPAESSPTGAKKEYFSKNKKAEEIGFMPSHTSLEGIEREIRAMLSQS